MRKSTKKWIAVIFTLGFFAWGLGFGGFNQIATYFGAEVPSWQQGQPVSYLVGTTIDTPDSAVVGSVSVRAYGDEGLTQLLGTATSDSTTGVFELSGNFESGQVVWLQANIADYYMSQPTRVVVGVPDANSKSAVGNVVVTDMATTGDLTISLTHFNGTALTAGANITGSSFTGFTIRHTGIASGESWGTTGYETVLSGIEGKTIITGVVIRIVVTGGSLYFSTMPDYTIDKGSTIEYVFIIEGEANSAYSTSDGIHVFDIALSGAQDSGISDIDVYSYADGDELDNTITLEDVSQGSFGSYTATESLLNLNII